MIGPVLKNTYEISKEIILISNRVYTRLLRRSIRLNKEQQLAGIRGAA